MCTVYRGAINVQIDAQQHKNAKDILKRYTVALERDTQLTAAEKDEKKVMCDWAGMRDILTTPLARFPSGHAPVLG